MQRFLILFSLILCSSICALAQAPLKKTLPNGLTILVQENHAAPVVAVRFYVKTGSIYEGQYLGAGISHLFEHVLQEGSKTRTKEQINAEAQAIGGQTNAYTSNDITAYHVTTAAPFFNRALENLADSMMNATFPEVEVKTQQGVIHHEMNMGDDDPDRVLWEAFYATAFIRHPVRLPVIGYQQTFDRITREDIVSYYQSHYTPDNTILSVAGDVKAEDIFAAAQKVMGAWERRSVNTPSIPDEPVQNTPRRVVIEKPVQNVSAMMGWHSIPIQHPDLYALDVLARVLGGGESSRLNLELREKRELVYGISSFSLTPNYDAGIFAIQATLGPDKLPDFEKAVWEEINKIKTSGVSAAELARAKRGMETDFAFNNDVEAQAERMAYDFLGTGDPNYSAHYVQNINAVTPAQVQAMAKKYLLENGVTTAIVRPESKGIAPATAAVKQEAVKPAQMFALKNGLRVIIRENKTTPTVAIALIGMGGVRLENEDKPGVANLALDMLQKGTTLRSSDAFAAIVDDLGGTLDISSGTNAWTVSSNWLARDWRRGLSLIHEALTMPAFPEAELRREKAGTIAEIKQQQDDPDAVSSLLLRRTFFGKHPYGRSPLGTLESVGKITREDVAASWKETFNPGETVLAIFGDVSAEEARRVMEYLFSSLNGPLSKASKTLPVIAPLDKQVVVQEEKPDITQTVIYIGYPGITVKDEDRYALTVLDAALSGIYYPGGRLHARLRDNQLVYGVHAFPMTGLDGGSFMVEAGTTKDKRDEVRRIMEEEVQKIRDTLISDEELERAKGMAITARAVDLQTNSAQASAAIADELFGLGYKNGAEYRDKINAITKEDVQRVAQKYLRPEASAIAIVEPK